MASTAIATSGFPSEHSHAPLSNAAIIKSVPRRSEEMITGSDRRVAVSEAIVIARSSQTREAETGSVKQQTLIMVYI
jgi:hypothetical protein